MKKLIALLLALVMVLSLAACGAKEEAPAAEAPAEAPAAEKVAVNMIAAQYGIASLPTNGDKAGASVGVMDRIICFDNGSTAIAMICGIPAAYALARMKFKGQTAFLGFIIVSQMFAPVVLLIGIYKVMQIMGLTNFLLGLIFINAAFNQAFTIWLLRGTFMSIEKNLTSGLTAGGVKG